MIEHVVRKQNLNVAVSYVLIGQGSSKKTIFAKLCICNCHLYHFHIKKKTT